MDNYKEIEGDLIQLAKEGYFDVITHGCNCLCNMGAGIAPQMAKAFGCNNFPLEDMKTQGSIDKLGRIDYQIFNLIIFKELGNGLGKAPDFGGQPLYVVNSYTQHLVGPWLKPLDYEALTLCLRKINYTFKGKHIGLPQIGCGLAGGDWNVVKKIIQTELKDCTVTVVIFKK